MATGGSSRPSGDVEDISVNKTTCAVCLEQYRRPKLLPCFHTFCQSCLQAVAGTAPSFPCPACRTHVLLPLGGVVALQTNYYIQDDVDAADPSAPRRVLCDVCSKDREATHTCLQCKQRYCHPCRKFHDSITSCRGHSVVSLEPDEEEAGNEGSCGGVTRSPHTAGVSGGRRKEEELCGKHGDQRLLLHCKQCSANICLQCKLTLHEGHPTFDLTDEGSRVKVKLEGRLEDIAAQIQRLEALLAVAESRCRAIDEQQQQAEQDIRNRAEDLISWANQSRDQAVQSVQLTATDIKSPLLSYSQRVRDKRVELSARHDHLTRVLQDENDADLISLEVQLEVACSDKTDMAQIEKDLGKKEPRLGLRHESAAVNQKQMRAFVGVVTSSQQQRDLSQGDATPDSEAAAEAVGVVQGADDKSAGDNLKKVPREVTYSDKPTSVINSMCPISNSRLWVKYQQKMFSSDSMMKLFDANGRVVQFVYKPVAGDSLATVLGNVIIVKGFSDTHVNAIAPDGMMTSVATDVKPGYLVHSAACGYPFFCESTGDQAIFRVTFSHNQPQKWISTIAIEKTAHNGELRDVSAKENYYVFTKSYPGQVRIYKRKLQRAVSLSGRYGSEEGDAWDCRFCQIDGCEVLLVLMKNDKRVHVVCYEHPISLLRYLDTGPSIQNELRELATDYKKHVWIGCYGGKIVVVDL